MIRQVFEYGPLVAWAVLLFTFVRPLRLGRAGNCALALFLLIASQKFLIYKFFGGDSFVPDLPERFVNLTGWSYSSAMILFAASSAWWVLRGLWRGLARLRGKAQGAVDRKGNVSVLLSLALLSLLVAGWGIWEGVRVPRVREVEVAVEGLSPAFNAFRIVQLSDLHCSPAARKGRTEGIVKRVNELNADLICITGDCVDGTPEKRRDDLAPLKDLKAREGVVGCTGNHEYYSDYAVWGPIYAEWGIHMLDNAHRTIERDGAQLVVGGVTDFAAVRNHTRCMEGPNLAKAFQGSPVGACRILLQHQPVNLAWNRRAGVKLQLSGHTHGGAVLGLDLLVKAMNQDHVRGLYEGHGITLYVSPGTGQWAGFPLRLGVPAEITVLSLRSK